MAKIDLTNLPAAELREAIERGDLMQRRTLMKQAKLFGKRPPFYEIEEWEKFKTKFEKDREAFNAKTKGEKVEAP